MDERIDLSYTLRDKRYRYIRNYLPHRPHFQPLIYLWLMPAMRSWEAEFKAGRCDAIQSAPWLDKPAEELFDIAADPHNVKNLAGDPAHAEALRRMRAALRAQLIENRDAALVPESILLAAVETDAGGRLIRSYTQDTRRYPVERIIDAADLASARDERNLPKLIELLANKDPAIQYWGAVGCVALGERAAPAADVLDAQLEHAAPAVQIAAAEALCRLGRSQPRAMDVLIGFATSRTKGATADAVANEALNALEALGGRAARAADAILAAAPYENEYQNRAASSLVAKFGKTLPGAPKP
jgi:hypothetical protein